MFNYWEDISTIDPKEYEEEMQRRKEEHQKKVQDYERQKAEILQREAEFNA